MQFLASFFDCFVVVCSLSCYNSKVIFLHKALKQIAFYKQWKEQIMSSKKLIKATIPVIALILIISTFTGCGKSDQWESGAAKGSEAEKKRSEPHRLQGENIIRENSDSGYIQGLRHDHRQRVGNILRLLRDRNAGTAAAQLRVA